MIEIEQVKTENVKVRILPDGRMSRLDAARYLGRAAKTLAQWALEGRGPRFVKINNRVFYYQSVLDDYIQGKV